MWLQVALLVASIVMTEKAEKQQRKHQERMLQKREEKAEDDKDFQMKKEQSALKKREAQIRARMGASGTGAAGGSSEAILQGMRDETRDNLLHFEGGFEKDKELNRMSASDGVSEGLKKAEKVMDYGSQLYGTVKNNS